MRHVVATRVRYSERDNDYEAYNGKESARSLARWNERSAYSVGVGDGNGAEQAPRRWNMNGGALAAQMAEFEVAASCSNNAVRSIGRGYRYKRNSARITPFRIHFFRGTSPAETWTLPPPLSLSRSRLLPTLLPVLRRRPRFHSPPRLRHPSHDLTPLDSPSLFLLRSLGVEQPSFVLVSLSIRLPSSLRRVCSGAHLVPEVKRGGIVAPVVLGTTTSPPTCPCRSWLEPTQTSCRNIGDIVSIAFAFSD